MNGAERRLSAISTVLGPLGVVAVGYGLYRYVTSSYPDARWPSWLGMLAAIIVGAVLVVSGASKATAWQVWAGQAAILGVPRIAIIAVPIAELALGALLITGIGWPVVPWSAVVLFGVFSVFIAVKLRTGQRPRCACFGAWSDRPISGRDLWRNAGLIGLALLSMLR